MKCPSIRTLKKLSYRGQRSTMWLLQIHQKYCHVGKASYRQYILLNIIHHSPICVKCTVKLIKQGGPETDVGLLLWQPIEANQNQNL